MADHYAVIGNPIVQSKSPIIHGMFGAATGQEIEYTKLLSPVHDSADSAETAAAFEASVRAFMAAGGRGMNVTAPFKLHAYAISDVRSESATMAGAVNAMKFIDGKIHVENFDGVGLLNDIQQNLGVSLAGKRILMLGAGGAVRGALLPFLSQQPASLVICSRDLGKAQGLVDEFSALGFAKNADGKSVLAATTYEILSQRSGSAGGFDVVLNATSASLTTDLPPIDASLFAGCALAYELAYGKGLTPFLKLAKTAGVPQIADGVGMLAEQAAEAFEWWRGIRPQTRAVIEQLTVPLI